MLVLSLNNFIRLELLNNHAEHLTPAIKRMMELRLKDIFRLVALLSMIKVIENIQVYLLTPPKNTSNLLLFKLAATTTFIIEVRKNFAMLTVIIFVLARQYRLSRLLL